MRTAVMVAPADPRPFEMLAAPEAHGLLENTVPDRQPPKHDPEKGTWDEYRLHMVNSVNSIQVGIESVQKSILAMRDYVDARLAAEREYMNERLLTIETRLRAVEQKGGVWTVLAAVATGLLVLLVGIGLYLVEHAKP